MVLRPRLIVTFCFPVPLVFAMDTSSARIRRVARIIRVVNCRRGVMLFQRNYFRALQSERTSQRGLWTDNDWLWDHGVCGGVYEARETVWAFGGAEDRRVASLESGADVA